MCKAKPDKLVSLTEKISRKEKLENARREGIAICEYRGFRSHASSLPIDGLRECERKLKLGKMLALADGAASALEKAIRAY